MSTLVNKVKGLDTINLVGAEQKEQRALLIGSVIASEEFKNAIKEAIKSGTYEDWGYNGEYEYRFDAFDEDIATDSVIEELNKHLL